MSKAYIKLATWLHSYELWHKPSSDQNMPNALFMLLFLYSWIAIMSPLLAVMMIIRYLRNH